MSDVPVNPIDLLDTLQRATDFYANVHAGGTVPLTGATMMFELLCVLADAVARGRG